MAKEKQTEVIEKPTFDYKNLAAEEYTRYIAHVHSLQLFDKHDFELYHAKAIFKKEFDENLNPVRRIVAIEVLRDQPIKKTRIPVHMAIDLNNQIEQNTAAGQGKYYLLKQN